VTHTDLRSVVPGSPLGDYFRRFWLPFAPASDLPPGSERPIRVQLLEERLVAFRDGQGRLGLIDGLSPHARGDLFFSTIDDEGIRCNYHGWKFDVQGTCIETPMHPDGFGIDTLAYPVAEHSRLIWAYLGEGDPPPLPGLVCGNDLRAARQRRPWAYAVVSELMQNSGTDLSVERLDDRLLLRSGGQLLAAFTFPGIVTRPDSETTAFIVPASEKATIVIGGQADPSTQPDVGNVVQTALEELLGDSSLGRA
jgi:nitrite reductase/ring-hydroxylating ferredoxin subunit